MYSYNLNVNLRLQLTDSPHGGQGNDFLELTGSADGQLLGNDIILTHFAPGIAGRQGPDDSWAAPAGADAILAQGATWGVYKDAQGVMHVSTNTTLYNPQAPAGTPEASKTVGLSAVTREQRSCYKKYSELRNRHMGYRSICCVRKAISPGCVPSLASSLPRATRIEVLQ